MNVLVQGGGGNPFDMGRLMDSVKKAQEMVQVETKKVQSELEKYVLMLGSCMLLAYARKKGVSIRFGMQTASMLHHEWCLSLPRSGLPLRFM